MPPEMHFPSPLELKEAFGTFQLSRLDEGMERKCVARNYLPPLNKFEKVRNNSGKYILVPTTIDTSFVFRGQTAFYDKCLPTLYRENLSEQDILIERLRCCEFEEYLKQMPEVDAFERYNYNIDYLGLSQHYGLKTDVIDLTSSIDVALFFAMCNMSKDGKSFYPQIEEKDYLGYIYAVGTIEMGSGPNNIKNLFDGKLSAIGMQPFYRPGNQRGFGMHLEKEETLTGLLYSFSYTKADSEQIYNDFANGNVLWHEDEISKVAREIGVTMSFSYKALNLCFKRYYKKSKSERKLMKSQLEEKGVVFLKDSLWKIDSKSLLTLQVEITQRGGLEGFYDIVQRKMRSGDGKIKHCVDTEFLTNNLLICFPTSGCKAPEGYDSPFFRAESKDGKLSGYMKRVITQEMQTRPNKDTGKVDKWLGDWKSLPCYYKDSINKTVKAIKSDIQ